MPDPFTISIYVPDGDPEGVRWTCSKPRFRSAMPSLRRGWPTVAPSYNDPSRPTDGSTGDGYRQRHKSHG